MPNTTYGFYSKVEHTQTKINPWQ